MKRTKAIAYGFNGLTEQEKAITHGLLDLAEHRKAIAHGFNGLAKTMKAIMHGFHDLEASTKAVSYGIWQLQESTKAITRGFRLIRDINGLEASMLSGSPSADFTEALNKICCHPAAELPGLMKVMACRRTFPSILSAA